MYMYMYGTYATMCRKTAPVPRRRRMLIVWQEPALSQAASIRSERPGHKAWAGRL
jgi:hypothetical protein